jgi:hypothetical protein
VIGVPADSALDGEAQALRSLLPLLGKGRARLLWVQLSIALRTRLALSISLPNELQKIHTMRSYCNQLVGGKPSAGI